MLGSWEGVKMVEKEEMWEFVSGELSGTLQGRREIPEDVILQVMCLWRSRRGRP